MALGIEQPQQQQQQQGSVNQQPTRGSYITATRKSPLAHAGGCAMTRQAHAEASYRTLGREAGSAESIDVISFVRSVE